MFPDAQEKALAERFAKRKPAELERAGESA